jgi:hypothetical protein
MAKALWDRVLNDCAGVVEAKVKRKLASAAEVTLY